MVKLTGLAREIFLAKYAQTGELEWDDTAYRVAKHISLAENGNQKEWENKFFEVISDMSFLPGGRILAGAGRPKASMLNCFSLEVEDSVHDIGNLLKNVYLISCGGGGCGIGFSKIRPKSDPIRNMKFSAPGVISEIKKLDIVGNETKGGGNRRVALLAILNIDHPDILSFLAAKLDCQSLNNFNISVGISNDFLKAIEKDKEWTFKFNNRTYYVFEIDKISVDGKVEKIQLTALDEEDAIGRAYAGYKKEFTDTFEHPKKIELKAKDLWFKIIDSAKVCGDPGLFLTDTVNNYTNVGYFAKMHQCNPCCSGDTKIAVADGRGAVSFKELADEGKDVPVFCRDKKGRIKVRWMRNPRVTGYGKPVYEVKFDDGLIVKVTDNHKFLLTNGSIKEAKDLKFNDSIVSMTRFQARLDEAIKPLNRTKGQDYMWINNGNPKQNKAEHRLIADFYHGGVDHKHVIHHHDFNGLNNEYHNLVVLTHKRHNEIHRNFMLGDNNPMRRWYRNASKEELERYHKNMSRVTSGENNARYCGINNDDLKKIIKNKVIELGRAFLRYEWQEYAEANNLPIGFSKYRQKAMDKNAAKYSRKIAKQIGLPYPNSDASKNFIENVEMYREAEKSGYISVRHSGNWYPIVTKKCERCSGLFELPWDRREIGYCSECRRSLHYKEYLRSDRYELRKIGINDHSNYVRNKQIESYNTLKVKLGREPMKKEWEDECRKNKIVFRIGKGRKIETFRQLKEMATYVNHRVVSIQFVGFEDVYNGTVDEFHNYFIGHHEGISEFGKPKFSYVCTRQCGEVPLENFGNCCLGSINLSNMYDEKKNDVNWKKLAKTARVAVRFLDNIITLNNYPIPETKEVASKSRRIGCGTLGVAYLIAKMGLKYGDKDCIEFLERLYATLRNELYLASIEIAKEKGSFPMFESEKFLKEEFCKTLPQRIRREIKKNGIRNAILSTIPPTGSLAILAGVSSGIEPIFAPVYKRFYRDPQDNSIWKYQIVVDKLFKEFYEKGKDTSILVGAYDLTPEDHLSVLATVQKFIDSAVSKTINVPEDITTDKLSDIILEFADSIKGLTIYRRNSRGLEPLQVVDISDKKELEKIMKEAEVASQSNDSCRNGVCDL